MKILFAGATGFLGSHLLPVMVEKGEVHIITRNPNKHRSILRRYPSLKIIEGDLTAEGNWINSVRENDWDLVLNFSGENIFGRWTKHKKKKIYDSRVIATENLLRSITSRPSLLINASAVGIYGDCEDRILAENSLPGEDELSLIVEEWERVVDDYSDKFGRVAILRLGIVLHRDALMIKKMLPAMKLFLGGYPGNGRNYISWIHMTDFIDIVKFIMEGDISGTFNVTAPHPVTFKNFCKQLGRILHRPCWAPIPVSLLKLVFGDLGEYLAYSQRAIPHRLTEAGFTFTYGDLEKALRSIFGEDR